MLPSLRHPVDLQCHKIPPSVSHKHRLATCPHLKNNERMTECAVDYCYRQYYYNLTYYFNFHSQGNRKHRRIKELAQACTPWKELTGADHIYPMQRSHANHRVTAISQGDGHHAFFWVNSSAGPRSLLCPTSVPCSHRPAWLPGQDLAAQPWPESHLYNHVFLTLTVTRPKWLFCVRSRDRGGERE